MQYLQYLGFSQKVCPCSSEESVVLYLGNSTPWAVLWEASRVLPLLLPYSFPCIANTCRDTCRASSPGLLVLPKAQGS